MKKTYSRIIALLLVAMICVPMCYVSSSAYYAVEGDVTYSSGSTGGYTVHTLSCNPTTGDYMPMVFAGAAGDGLTIQNHYSVATNTYGYQVAGAVNGSFFMMDDSSTYGTLITASGNMGGLNICNGKIAAYLTGFYDSVVTFNSNGEMKICETNLKTTINIGGYTVDNWIYSINQGSGSATWDQRFYYFDYSCGGSAPLYSSGTVIRCQKKDNTDIAVGQTLIGEVLSITSYTTSGSVGSDEFLLYMAAGSEYEYLFADVEVGDTIRINTEEQISGSVETMESANSAITNVGWLVKNGTNQTTIYSTIGTHSVTYASAWTAFGTKSDGTFVIFTSPGSSGSSGLTLRQVASYMISLGCTNVIRMDGGGSVGMYVSNTGSGYAGYNHSATRAVADTIMIVKRSSVQIDGLKNDLSDAIASAEDTLAMSDAFAGLSDKITAAKTVYNSTTSVSGDYKREIMELLEYSSGSGLLNSSITSAYNISTGDYCDRVLDLIQTYYVEGQRLLSAGGDDDIMKDLAIKISTAVGDTTSAQNRVSLGKKYAAQTSNATYPDSGTKELTDGALYGPNYDSAQWSGYLSDNATGEDADGKYTDILIDLGAATEINGFSLTALNRTDYGIYAPKGVKVYASDDGNDFYYHSQLASVITPVDGVNQTVMYDLAVDAVETRYVLFRVYFNGTHIFVGEASVYANSGSVGTGITHYDTYILTDYASIFTSATGTVTHDSANVTWAHAYICTYDNGSYYVSGIVAPMGDTTYSYTVSGNDIIIGLHGSAYENANAQAAVVGDKVYLTGLDVASGTILPAGRITFATEATDTVTYSDPYIGIVGSDSGIQQNDEYLVVNQEAMEATELAAAVLDPRAVIADGAVGTGLSIAVAATNCTYTVCVVGDMNGDGMVTAIDYLMLKRSVLGTYTSDGAQTIAGNIDGSAATDSTDYLMLKRYVLGTFDIFA